MTTHPKDAATREQVFDAICDALLKLPCGVDLKRSDIRLESSLISDLGLDSIYMVEFAVLVEDALGLPEIPLNAWRERESEKQGPRFTVGSLVDLCLRLRSASDAGHGGDRGSAK